MSEARIAQLREEIEHQQQRQKDFSAYPESVAAAERAEQAARDELEKLGADGDDDGEPKTLEERVEAVGSHDEANALAVELGVDGFEAKKPKLDEKKDALRAKAAELAAEQQ